MSIIKDIHSLVLTKAIASLDNDAARGDDAAVDEEVVAQVDVGLEGRERGVPLGRQGLGREHGLQGGTDPVLEGDEAQAAGVATGDDTAGHADDVVGLVSGREVGVASRTAAMVVVTGTETG